MGQVYEEDTRTYVVLKNAEDQYSLWLKSKRIPDGWIEAGKEGKKAECMTYVDQTWIDMRPLSLRREMNNGMEPL